MIQTENEFLNALQRDAGQSVELFSNKNKETREKMVVRAFLRCLGEDFKEEEIRIGSNEPIDISFRQAKFQITEVLDSGRRRTDEIKQRRGKHYSAESPRDLWEKGIISSEPMSFNNMVDLVRKSSGEKWEKYASCQGLDLLVYINLQGRHLFPIEPWPSLDEFGEQGWRSLSVLFPPYSLVLFAGEGAPQFLSSKVGLARMEYELPYGLFEP